MKVLRMVPIQKLRQSYSSRARGLFTPMTAAIGRSGITPNQLTVLGLLLAIAVAFLVWYGYFFIAAVVFAVGGLMDMLDGAVARLSEKVTPLGAFIDSTFDRLGEGIVLTSIALFYAREGDLWVVGATFATLIGSFLVSYTRARAEALGRECKVGLMTRAERLVLLGIGLALQRFGVLAVVMYILSVLTAVTVLQRILHVRRQFLELEAQKKQTGP
ncbi:CDP-diacylglycerol--inositol 3-phosphatidyltransferase [bacterium BMS3Abin01]|nr:CDP-diacylglycerol--inositol 3-phosphatidyltransferase [bacterium BMS3Abin01]HDY69641.1 CDP-alcohol phosphatidyltransferase family protein [Actinomycetota bacterium]